MISIPYNIVSLHLKREKYWYFMTKRNQMQGKGQKKKFKFLA